MRAKRTKYTLRKDGRIVMTKTIEGKRVSFYGQTDKEVEQKYENYLKAKPKERKPKVRTFDKVAEDWWERKYEEISPNSVTQFRSYVKELSAEFKGIPVDEMTPGDIVAYLRRLAAQGYAQKSIGNKKSIIKSILDDALIEGEIKSNPCVNLPFVKGKPEVKRTAASDDDIAKIEAAKEDSNIARMMYFCLYTGCRRGEAAALQWKHVNLEAKTAHICQTLAYETSAPIIKESPKTYAGIRDVFLPDNVIDNLPKYNNPNTYVFSPKGLPRAHAFQYAIDKYRQKYGIKCTPHQLRHSYATMLHSAGVDAKDAQVLLGHASVTITQDIYTELESKHREAVTSVIQDYIAKNKVLSETLSKTESD